MSGDPDVTRRVFCRACGEVMPAFWAPLHFEDCAEIRHMEATHPAATDTAAGSGEGVRGE